MHGSLLHLPNPPDAVFAFNDYRIGRVQSLPARKGLRVPEDMGICGYDDIASSATAHP